MKGGDRREEREGCGREELCVFGGGEPGFSGLALVQSGRGLSEVALVSTHTTLLTLQIDIFILILSIYYLWFTLNMIYLLIYTFMLYTLTSVNAVLLRLLRAGRDFPFFSLRVSGIPSSGDALT